MIIDQIKNQSRVLLGVLLKGRCLILWVTLLFMLTGFQTSYAAHTLRVARVIDGDTVVLDGGEIIRLLGINTPELGFHGKPMEAGAMAAKLLLEQYVFNKQVSLVYDTERKDHYGRTLAHLFIEDGRHINALMLDSGLAALSIHPPNLNYSAELVLAQQVAENSRRGIWGMVDYNVQPVLEISAGKIKKWGRFIGRISKIKSSAKGTKLWLNTKTYIWVAKKNERYFPNLNNYVGKIIEVRGWPRKWGRNWSINAIHSSQILLQP